MPSLSSTETRDAHLREQRSMVVTSRRCGTFDTCSGSSLRIAAQRIGSAAFLAPEMRTSPLSGDAALDDQFVHAATGADQRCAHLRAYSVCIDSA